MIKHFKGNLLESGCDVICHQVNLQGIMGGGLALAISMKFPDCEKQYAIANKNFDMRGNIHLYSYTENGKIKYVANCFSQEESFNTNYEWLKECFKKVINFAKGSNLKTIGVPKNYGCGIANGSWDKVLSIFEELFRNEPKLELQIWEL